MKNDRGSKPSRGRQQATASRGGPRKPTRAFEPGARRPPPARAPRDRDEASDPYKPARRPPRNFEPRGESDDRFARGARKFGERSQGERSARGFTVSLDPDVARVFRGDASVNRALRLVMQLMQVVQGPPSQRHDRPPRGYQGSPEARGFTRRPRFEDDDEGSGESHE